MNCLLIVLKYSIIINKSINDIVKIFTINLPFAQSYYKKFYDFIKKVEFQLKILQLFLFNIIIWASNC